MIMSRVRCDMAALSSESNNPRPRRKPFLACKLSPAVNEETWEGAGVWTGR